MADDEQNQAERRAFWSGTIAFGLVSLPVHLFTANRSNRTPLRMLTKDGTPLRRRYFCSKEEKILDRDELIRGYEVEPQKFIEISDDELTALQPDKSREIDLRRFVPLDQLDPALYERGYFLIPDEGAVKAYRLLAHTMETASRAGIATVVMRGKEYLIAIIAKGGILRAETLRFIDELRQPQDVGLPELDEAAKSEVKKFTAAIKKLSRKSWKKTDQDDTANAELMKLIKRKIKAGDDVIAVDEAETETEDDDGSDDNVIDLMAVLKQRLKGD